MRSIRFHLGLRQAVMALMDWAIDVPQKLWQSDAKPFFFPKKEVSLYKWNKETKEELIIK